MSRSASRSGSRSSSMIIPIEIGSSVINAGSMITLLKTALTQLLMRIQTEMIQVIQHYKG